MRLMLAIVVAVVVLSCAARAEADTYRVRLDPGARDTPATGRVMLLFISETRRPYDRALPMEAPFFHKPQPIASIAVKDFKGGEVVTLDGASLAFSASLDKLDGKVRLQAVLDADQTERSFLEGPGNAYSEVVEVELSSSRDDVVEIAIAHPMPPRQRKAEFPNLKYVELRSDMLSKFHGRDVHHRAGVALPMGHNVPNYPRQQWPAIYVIPGYGGRDDEAADYADMLMTNGIEEIAPIAVHIVLDPETPLGHHGFADSACNGPVGTALVQEFIPYLEEQFRLIAKPEARIVTGHSSGGWSSLWLQLAHPEIFGACWSRSPDPVDFSAFQMTDLYADNSVFSLPDGSDSPSYRGWISSREQGVFMTVRQEKGMEHAIDPNGRSGQQWDAWDAMFSTRDEKTGLPAPMFDPLSGAIHKDVVEHWKAYDIARLIESDWKKYEPIMRRVRLVCGDQDSYYLERAVMRLRDKIDTLRKANAAPAPDEGEGYILLVPKADHATVITQTYQRWNSEMREYLKSHDMLDPGPPRATRPAPAASRPAASAPQS